MTQCENCHCYLASNAEMVHHLQIAHNVHVRFGGDSHLAYCNDCHRYCGKKQHSARRALEKHLKKYHDIDIQETSGLTVSTSAE